MYALSLNEVAQVTGGYLNPTPSPCEAFAFGVLNLLSFELITVDQAVDIILSSPFHYNDVIRASDYLLGRLPAKF
jgi:hypothetical protein